MRKNLPVTGVERDYPADANILSTTDLHGTVTYANEDFVRVSGFALDELMGQNHNIVRHPDMPPVAFADLWSTIKTGKSWMGVVKNRCKNGDHYWVDAYVTPIVENGKVAEYQSVRSKPARALVERAEGVYRELNAGRTPAALRSRPLPLKYRLLLGNGIALALVATFAVLLGGAAMPWAVGGFGLGLAISAALTFTLTAPLDQAVAEARKVVASPVVQYIYTGRNDEAGQLLVALKMLRSESGGIVGRIADTARQMIGGAGELNASVEQSNQGIQRQSTETDMVATAVNQMTASIQEVANNARNTSSAADHAAGEADAGRRVVERTTDTIQALAREVESAATVIRQLEQDSDNISAVLDVISGIAEQTNLLALNAAIEAARAGEQGRGFAVVADEVRVLATRTRESTREIQTMIERLQAVAREAVTVMGRGSDQADKSVAQAAEAAGSLEAITRAVATINEMSAQIAVAVNEQSTVAEEVNRSITNIRDLSHLTVDSARKSEEAGHSMNLASHRLLELAEQFWGRKR